MTDDVQFLLLVTEPLLINTCTLGHQREVTCVVVDLWRIDKVPHHTEHHMLLSTLLDEGIGIFLESVKLIWVIHLKSL